jgi:hypothetical protein
MATKHGFLSRVLGHLAVEERTEEFAQLQDLLSRSAFPEDTQELAGSMFSFEGADLFSPERVAPAQSEAIEKLAQTSAAPEYRLFVRQVPVRSTQLHGSNPSWAGGAALERSLGPFVNRDGRRFWFDFFRIEKLVALYVQGVPEPALLFRIRTGFQFIDVNLPLSADMRPNYKLSAGSIWINSRLLASNAPPGFFSGLTIRSGNIALSATPQVIDGRLTIAPNTTVRVQLQLQQQPVNDADPASEFGKDARAAEIELPEEFAFHFAGGNHAIDTLARASWRTYGHEAAFDWRQQQATTYDPVLNRVLIPVTASTERFEVTDNQSPFHTLSGETKIVASFWALPTAAIDVANPSAAEGIGALVVRGENGLTSNWAALKGGPVNLIHPYVMASPGRIAISDLSAGNALCQQDFELWKDKLNPYGTTAKFQYLSAAPFFFNTIANGVELVSTLGNADVRADRPVTAKGEPIEIRSKKSLLIIAATTNFRFLYLFDDNILVDNLDLAKRPPQFPKPLSLVLSNALFKTTAVNGCLLFGTLAEDFVNVERASLFLTLGLQAYLPTLPDPYAANIEQLRFQFRGSDERSLYLANQANIWLLLICRVKWEPVALKEDQVGVSFHFAPLPNQPPWTDNGPANDFDFVALAGGDPNTGVEPQLPVPPTEFKLSVSPPPPPPYGDIWERAMAGLQRDQFALLDVSTNADLLGVSFGSIGTERLAMRTTLLPAESGFPLQVKGMEVVSRGMNVRAFTVPQISWEPVINLTPPAPSKPDPLNPTPPTIKDPPFGPNYYPDDGGPTRVINNSADQVALAPIPLSDFLVENFADKKNFAALSLFTLPFGLRALALLQKKYPFGGGERRGADLHFNTKNWDSGVTGARQLRVDGGESVHKGGESDMFMGSTVQVDNILDTSGSPTGTTTLGQSVSEIFNNEFLLSPSPQIMRQRGVPLSRMDLSGYGASIFSDWRNPKAGMAETSQAKFDVFVGRCAHEIIQVRTILYPFAAKFVRTISLFRANSGYFYRFDSGWVAESDGRFDFTYFVYIPGTDDDGNPVLVPVARNAGYSIHPGIVHGLFQIRNIRETTEVERFTGTMQIPKGGHYVDINGQEVENKTGANFPIVYNLQPVFFDADIEIENPVSGFVTKEVSGAQRKLVPSKRILGFVQLAPRGMPLTADAFKDLLARQSGNIGGPIDCVIDIGGSGQQMRLNRFDMSNSFAADGVHPAFAAPGRGSVLLPKDGSWSLVKHEAGTGQVSPVPPDLSVPLIRVGQVIPGTSDYPTTELLRIANPTELLRAPAPDTINYGFLQSTDTQKALFLTPSFKQGVATLLSKTPPLFADAFRIVKSKGIFPNIGDAVTNFGDVISLLKKGTEFNTSTLKDGGKNVFELMQINDGVDAAKKEGYKLLKKVDESGFDLPAAKVDLINLSGAFRIYLEYKAQKSGQANSTAGKLNFNVDSFANNVADQWKSKMTDVGVVVDLGPIPRLMTIKGNWDSKKGAEASYGGNPDDPSFPAPQIEFAKELQPVIDILQILQDLQTANYKAAFEQGLKLAMSNKAGSWEYKLEAAKEIPVVKFPMPPFDNDPNAPLKLEAGLRLGAYFNTALTISSDPKDLLPSAGAFLGFYGRLSVMCVSLSIATVYAVGQVTLDIAADSKVGPTLRMKFGFGAQIVVGLPVVGNVSVLYMVGVEIYTDSTQLNISAFMLYQGHAELAAGLVSVTITIEAKGTIKRATDTALPGGGRTDLEAQVTFGLDISIFLVIDISFSKSWSEQRQIA